jgi:hypothetical protein
MGNLSETLNAIFNSGHSIRFQNVVRRKEGEWYSQIIWEHLQQPGNSVIKSCDWFGFETIDEAADNCLTYLTILDIK